MKNSLLIILCFVLVNACTGLPDGITPVKNFNLNQYQGKWYEIARLDHSFERDMSDVTATYEINPDGTVSVTNKGFHTLDKEWQQANGTAKFVGKPDVGHLKVSFFGPFYGAYVIFKLDQTNYQYAYVTSYNKEYLWLLSRTPTVSPQVLKDFKQTAQQYGFSVEQIIYVQHSVI